jgi:electron transport complex protein RnfC
MRKTFSFHGGIHPPENKHQSMQRPIAQAGIPDQLVIPLSQHIGAPASPCVIVGDRVLKGQLIADAGGFVSVSHHAPTSGIVKAIEERVIAHPSGLKAPCIVIDPDGEDLWVEHAGVEDFESMTAQDLVTQIREAGIAGMGGAGFPSAVKLSIKAGTQIETLIINGTECEPYITADDILMQERACTIIEGVRILQHILQPQETLIGVEDNKPLGIAALQLAAQGTGIEVVSFPTKYPSGGEKQLIEILTGKQVPHGGLPSDIGVVCQNLGTSAAIADAILRGEPLISRVTTVTGEAIDTPQNYEVLLGTSMQYLLEKAGYRASQNKRLIVGGPMMGFSTLSAEVPVIKTTNCVLAPTEKELPTPPPAQACIRCGMCAEACPASLLPQQLFWFSQGKEYEKLEDHKLFDCIECGACSWVCPSNIPLVQYYRSAKADILQMRVDHEKSEQSKARFEARETRLAQQVIEREAKRAARKKAAEERAKAASDGDGEDPVQAAIARAKAKKDAQENA